MTLNSLPHNPPDHRPMRGDVLIVGAGPAGLFQVFELGLLGLRAHVIDPLPRAGGQCIELYADKPIYDIPALPSCTGEELISRLMNQIKVFEPTFHFNEWVQSIEPLQNEKGFKVQSSSGLCLEVKAVVLANGVGAFLPRSLNAPEQSQYLGRELFHGEFPTAWAQFERQAERQNERKHQRLKIWVVGGDEEAVSNALVAFKTIKGLDITLIHRRQNLELDTGRLAQWQEALLQSEQLLEKKGWSAERSKGVDEHSTLQFKHGQIVHLYSSLEDAPQDPSEQSPDDSTSDLNLIQAPLLSKPKPLKALQWVDETGQMYKSEVDMLMVNLGLTPQLGPIAQWGVQMLKKQIPVNTEDFSTSVAGIFAIGDVITYPGKKRLILSGFHEAALASFGVAKWVLQQDRIPFEYTSASALLQSRLGVKT